MRIKKYPKTFMVEIMLVSVLMLLSLGLYNPYWMPMGIQLVLLISLVVLFGFFMVFFWREQGGDEREVVLRHMSDRVGFLTGAFVLLLAIVVNGLIFHELNGWIIGALIAMIAGKVCSFIYHDGKDEF